MSDCLTGAFARKLRAILVSVSPWLTRYVLPASGAADSGAVRPEDGLAAGARLAAGGAVGTAVARWAGAAGTVGAVTGAALLAVSPGVYTGGGRKNPDFPLQRAPAPLPSPHNIPKGA